MTAQKGFDGKTCAHTDMSPCLADLGEPWLRYEVCVCVCVCVCVHARHSRREVMVVRK